MTRKDYRLIADAMSKLPPSKEKAAAVKELCDAMLIDNPRFNPALFTKACGPVKSIGDWE